jgi:DNA anti-recombination protein RmuC
MKLQELDRLNPTKQTAKVFESYFGQAVDVTRITRRQAQKMLNSVRKLVSEHRRTADFHRSEKNPAYLKLVMMEQALTARVMEQMPMANPAMAQVNPAKQAGLQAAQIQQNKRAIQDQIKQKQQEIQQLQKQMNMPTMAESRASLRRRLQESEVQQAQVVLASQDMVDQVQKMLEQVSAMQFKDLPALVDQVKNQVGVDQAMQFNTDASAALTGMIQNLQTSKGQLEQALGVVTGQAPAVPGEASDMDAGLPGEMPDDMGAELPPGEEEIETDIEVDDEKDSNALATSLGRGRR